MRRWIFFLRLMLNLALSPLILDMLRSWLRLKNVCRFNLAIERLANEPTRTCGWEISEMTAPDRREGNCRTLIHITLDRGKSLISRTVETKQWRATRDLSLRLKNGSVRDDAD
jgi:hypothetical protein